mgnify:CR=1 FL=1
MFVGRKGNVPILSGDFSWEESKGISSRPQTAIGSELENVGIATVHAKYPSMAVYKRRMESFLTMAYDHIKGAEELAIAGYFLNSGKSANYGTKALLSSAAKSQSTTDCQINLQNNMDDT